ncbi:MAG: PQQ-dependent sugar dehydrogenase, partial [Leucothrix sp.]
ITNLAVAETKFKTQTVAEVQGVPWGLAQLDSNTLIYTLRSGGVGLINTPSGQAQSLTGIPDVAVYGQGGMLDVAVQPDYVEGDWIYFTYSKMYKGSPETTLARAVLAGNELSRWQDLLITEVGSNSGNHFGSRIAFDDAGHVFFGVGDRGERDNAQKLTNHAGAIMRLNLDGSIPDDNPFVGNANALPEIYSYGHRNPQGLMFDAATKRLWEIEHGPRGGDEINLIGAGKNYGWPVISYGKEYWAPLAVGEGTKKAGMEQPVKEYTPSIAPGSLIIYRGEAFPKWQGNLFASALKLKHINRVELNKSGQAIAETRLLKSFNERIRDLLETSEGYFYFSTDSGKIMRLVPDKS